MDLNQLLASLGLSPVMTAVLAGLIGVLLTWLKMKPPTPVTPSNPTPPPANPQPVPPATPTPNDPLAGLPGLPGHPLLNGLLAIMPLLRILIGGAAVNKVFHDVKPHSGQPAELSAEEDTALVAISTAVKSSKPARQRMLALLDE